MVSLTPQFLTTGFKGKQKPLRGFVQKNCIWKQGDKGLARSRNIIILTMLYLFILLFLGCEDNKTISNNIKGQSQQGIYPLKTDVTLKYWMILHNNISQVADNFGELPIAKELEKRTGIKVKYIHPPKGQEKEAFSIMAASGELPDIIEYSWLKYPGGPNNAIENDIIMKLDDLIENHAPNLKKFLNSHPDINKMVKTDDGHYYVFPFLRPDEELLVTFGPVVRADWLQEINLDVPETLDDWYKMLKAFKDFKGAQAPLTATVKLDDDRNTVFSEFIKLFAGATDSYQEFYIDNGKVKFGPIEPNRRKFFETMARWYKEGLIDRNFAINDNKSQDSNMLNGKSGATICSGGSGLGKWLVEMRNKDSGFDLTAVPYPAPNKGEIPRFGVRSLEYSGPGSAAIWAKSKNSELAAKYLDYMYGEEGHMLINFGIENQSYKQVNGEPLYTDLIMNNSDKLTPVDAMSMYIRGHTNGAFIQDRRYIEQYYSLPQQKEALKVWDMTHQKKYRMLPVTPTKEESIELSRIIKNVNNYVDEMTLRFIMGQDPVYKFDEYVRHTKRLGIDRAVEIYQNALERYNRR